MHYEDDSYGEPATFNGQHFDSRTEAAWAAYFYAAGMPYIREPESFSWGQPWPYTPDFYLPEQSLYVEVKNGMENPLEVANKALRLARGIGEAVMIANGMPRNLNLYFFAPDSTKQLDPYSIDPLRDMSDLNLGRNHLKLYPLKGEPISPMAEAINEHIAFSDKAWTAGTDSSLQRAAQDRRRELRENPRIL